MIGESAQENKVPCLPLISSLQSGDLLSGARKIVRRRKKIRTIVSKLQEGNFLKTAIHASGIKSRVTLFNWRKKPRTFSKFWHLRLDKLIEKTLNMADDKRTEAVESKFLKRLIDGTAGSAEYFFYLCNRAGHRWKNQSAIANTNILKFEQALAQKEPEESLFHNTSEKDLNALINNLISKG